MRNKLREIFGIESKYKDERLTDKDPCDTCPIYQEMRDTAKFGNIAERQYIDGDDLCFHPCIERITWEMKCITKLAWLENKISKGEIIIR